MLGAVPFSHFHCSGKHFHLSEFIFEGSGDEGFFVPVRGGAGGFDWRRGLIGAFSRAWPAPTKIPCAGPLLPFQGEGRDGDGVMLVPLRNAYGITSLFVVSCRSGFNPTCRAEARPTPKWIGACSRAWPAPSKTCLST